MFDKIRFNYKNTFIFYFLTNYYLFLLLKSFFLVKINYLYNFSQIIDFLHNAA